MTVILAIFIVIAAISAILPAYLLIRSELITQFDQRLHDAVQHTQTILSFEQEQLENTITLASQRPTLMRFMRERNLDELAAYLRVFQNSTSLDYLYVVDSSGEFLAGTTRPADRLTLSFTTPVDDLGFVTGGVLLDEAFAVRLREQTGFHYEFYPTGIDREVLPDKSDGTTYYREFLSLQDLTNNPSATLAVMLPVTGLLASEGKIVTLLLLTTLTVAFLAALSGGLYIRRRIRPLWKLTAAAREMGQGNLAKPITTPSTIPEIHTLASVLEQSRTRLQQTLKELSLAKEWSEALIQSISEGIITLDKDGIVQFFSEGAEHITHLSPDEALGQNINTLFSTSDGTPFTDFLPPEGGRRSVAVGASQDEPITLMITRARQTEGNAITIVIHDITEEMQRRSLQTYFLANISHEFRTPLAGMKVSIELLLENARYLSGAELNELLNSLHLSVSSLQNLIDNLLESSKIEANHFSLRRQPIQIAHTVSEALRLIQPFLNRRHQHITLDQPFVLPTISADATRLTQVLVNLLANASKYSPMNSIIDITLDIRSNGLYVAIADRGQGIPEEQRESVFRQFVRLNREAKSDYSAGLGLAVVKAIVEAHSGQIGVDNRDGGGAIFWFMLPTEGDVLYESAGR